MNVDNSPVSIAVLLNCTGRYSIEVFPGEEILYIGDAPTRTPDHSAISYFYFHCATELRDPNLVGKRHIVHNSTPRSWGRIFEVANKTGSETFQYVCLYRRINEKCLQILQLSWRSK